MGFRVCAHIIAVFGGLVIWWNLLPLTIKWRCSKGVLSRGPSLYRCNRVDVAGYRLLSSSNAKRRYVAAVFGGLVVWRNLLPLTWKVRFPRCTVKRVITVSLGTRGCCRFPPVQSVHNAKRRSKDTIPSMVSCPTYCNKPIGR